jgi:tRNA pseudouridine55 synthase
MDGVLVVDKPLGPTSHDVVARVRGALGIRAVGHTGTLDPLATGVLPLVIGRATRLAQFLSGLDKEYVADIRFGFATSTYDRVGEPLPHPDDHRPVPEDLSAAVAARLDDFRGSWDQVPPPYSAKKIEGTPAYKLARSSKPVALKPVRVSVSELELIDRLDQTVRLRLVCSSGFYVRTLAHELGLAVGCGAHLQELRRTRAGHFSIDAALPLERIESEGSGAERHLLPMNEALPGFPEVVVNERGARRASHGNVLGPDDFLSPPIAPANQFRVVDGDGRLLAVGRSGAGGVLQPVVVLV